MNKINFKQPKYMIPLITLPFALYIGYNLNQYSSDPEKPKVEKLSTNLGDNEGIDEIYDKQRAYDEAYQMDLDQQTALGGLANEKDSMAYYRDNLTDVQKRRLDSIDAIQRMQGQIDRANRENQKINRNYYNPNSGGQNFANNTRQREDQDYDRSMKLLNAINSNSERNNQKPVREASNEYEESPEKWRKEQLKLMREQMIFADSLEQSKDPEYKAQSMAQKMTSDNSKKRKFYMNSTLKVSKNSKSENFNSFYKENNESFIKAVVDENIKGYMGSRLKIRLVDDIYIGNMKIQKGTALFALITGFDSQRVKLSIVSALYKNQILPINLTIYDVDGMEGLYVPASAFREMSKEMGESMVQGQQLGTGSADFFNSMLTSLYKSSSQTIAQILRKNKAKIKYNTHIYLIDNSDLDKQREQIYKNNNR